MQKRSPSKRLMILLLASALAGQFPCLSHGQSYREWWGLRGCQPCRRCPPAHECVPGRSLFWNDPCCEYDDSCVDTCRHRAKNPRWYGSIEAYKLFRDISDELPFAALGPAGPIVLSTSDFDAEFESSAKTTLGMFLEPWYRVEVTYAGSQDWNDSVAVRNLDDNGQGSLGNLMSPFSNFGNPAPIAGVDFNDFASISFSSSLSSVELNLRRLICLPPRRHGQAEASFLVGLRYMGISEDFDYRTVSTVGAGSINDVNVSTDNDMFGVQLGMMFQILVHPRGWIDVDTRGVMYHNNVNLRSAYANTDGIGTPITSFTGIDDQTRTSFMGELSLTFNYQVTPTWTFRVGYNAIGISGVALGADNMNRDINLLSLGPPRVDHSGEVVYHGPSIGAVWAR